jgi:hypothetical protein
MKKFMFAVLALSTLAVLSHAAFAQEENGESDEQIYDSLPGEETPNYDADSGALVSYSKYGDGVVCVRTVHGNYYCDFHR